MKLQETNASAVSSFITAITTQEINPKEKSLISSDLQVVTCAASFYMFQYIFECCLFRLIHVIIDFFVGYDYKYFNREHLAENIALVTPRIVNGSLTEDQVARFVENVSNLQQSFSCKEQAKVAPNLVQVQGYLTEFRMNRIIDALARGEEIDFGQIGHLVGEVIIVPSTGLSIDHNDIITKMKGLMVAAETPGNKELLAVHLKKLFAAHKDNLPQMKVALEKFKYDTTRYGKPIIYNALEEGRKIDSLNLKPIAEDDRMIFHEKAETLDSFILHRAIRKVFFSELTADAMSNITTDIHGTWAENCVNGYFAHAQALRDKKVELLLEIELQKIIKETRPAPHLKLENKLFATLLKGNENLSTEQQIKCVEQYKRLFADIAAKKVKFGPTLIDNSMRQSMENGLTPLLNFDPTMEDKRLETRSKLALMPVTKAEFSIILQEVLNIDAPTAANMIQDIYEPKAVNAANGFFGHATAFYAQSEAISQKLDALFLKKKKEETAKNLKQCMAIMRNSQYDMADVTTTWSVGTALEEKNRMSPYGFLYVVLSNPELRAEMKVISESHVIRLESFFKLAFTAIPESHKQKLMGLFAERMQKLKSTELNVPSVNKIKRLCKSWTTWANFIHTFYERPNPIQKVVLQASITDEQYKEAILESFKAAAFKTGCSFETRALIVNMCPIKYLRLILTDPTLRKVANQLVLENRMQTKGYMEQVTDSFNWLINPTKQVKEESMLSKLIRAEIFPDSFDKLDVDEAFKPFWNAVYAEQTDPREGFKKPVGIEIKKQLQAICAADAPQKIFEVLDAFFKEEKTSPDFARHYIKQALPASARV